MTDREKLDAIEALCRNLVSVWRGSRDHFYAHQLAGDVLEIIDEKTTNLTDIEIVKRTEPDRLP